MSPLMIGLCAFVALIVLMLLRCPIAVSMFIVGAGGLLITKGSHLAFYALSTTPYNAIFSFSLVAIPMFILLGNLANEAGVTDELFSIGNKVLGRCPGGLGIYLRRFCCHYWFFRWHGGCHDPHCPAPDGPLRL